MTSAVASSRERSSGDLLRHPIHSGHITVSALKRHKDKPVLFLGETTLTGGELADRISQYIQAFEALGAGTGSISGLLSLNRPEVLMIIGASQTQGYRRTALHPLGSLDDHAFVLSDAEVTSLIIDPNPMFVERALGLLEKVPSLKQILTIGPVPEALAGHAAVDLTAEAAKYEPKPLVAADLPPDHIGGMTYTGGTTGKPKGVMGTYRSGATMTMIQMAEWEWPEDTRFLDLHAAVARGRGVLHPDVAHGRRDRRAAALRSRPGARDDREVQDHRDDDRADDALRAARPSRTRQHRRPRASQTVYYGAVGVLADAPAGGDPPARPDLLPVLRPGRVPDGDHVAAQGRPRRRRPERLATCGRPTPWCGPRCSTTTATRCPQGEPGEICVQGRS